jgi:hypothetical protein
MKRVENNQEEENFCFTVKTDLIAGDYWATRFTSFSNIGSGSLGVMTKTILYFLVVAVVTVNVSCVMPKNNSKIYEVLLSRFRPTSLPNVSALQGGYNARPDSSAEGNAKYGFISVSTFSDPICSAVKYTTGVPVNTCFIAKGFAYMFRMVEGSLPLRD